MSGAANKSQLQCSFRERITTLKNEILVIAIAVRHPLTPWHVKVFAAIVVGYAFSPIDLIPDFIPVLGYIDDLILIPIGILIVKKMIPVQVYEECRTLMNKSSFSKKPFSWIGVSVVIIVWILIIAFITVKIIKRLT